MQLCEKYRPKYWESFIGQERAVGRVRALMSRQAFGAGGGEAFWISGPTGTGKSSLAYIMAKSVGVEPGGAWNYLELDGDKCTADQVRALDERTRAAHIFGDTWQVFIINEAHAMTPRAVQAWLTLLERLPARWLVIFTSTEETSKDLFGNFTRPLLARCKLVEFTNQGLAQVFARRAREIAVSEGLDGQPESKYLRLVQDCHNSMREVLQRIDAGEMINPVGGAQ